MEEEKAAALYDELTRKGSGAARFKQGLGFSSGASDPPPKASALPSSSSSFLSQFVKASNSTSEKATTIDREKQKSQIENIQNKFRKKEQSSIEPQSKDRDRRSDRERDRDSERHSREIRSTERARRRRSRSRSCSSEERDRRHRRRRRSRSRSYSDEDRRRRRERRRRSPSYERSERGRGDRETRRRSEKKESNGGGIDCAKLIQGYDNMTPAERVKAKMKLQLSETAAKDTKIGTGSGWERFEFNTDAPLDNEDDEIEGAHDDTKVVKHLGQTFRFSNVQARREEEIKSAHDEAMFGAPAAAHDEAIFGAPVRSPSVASEGAEESENEKKQIESNDPSSTGLFSDKLLAKKQGSWRDRAPRNMK